MYTGLIEETGTIRNIENNGNSMQITIECKKIIDGLKIGDSVGINGACQTVTEIINNSFKVFASYETLAVTTFKSFKTGLIVNLERTMKLSDRLDGHLVSGHVDGTSIITNITKIGETTEFSLKAGKEFLRQIVKKGSVTIDGISLTVADIQKDIFKIAVIPHTFKSTNLQYLKIGDRVNLETDMIAKYIEKYLLSNDNSSNIDMNLLERNGFL